MILRRGAGSERGGHPLADPHTHPGARGSQTLQICMEYFVILPSSTVI